MEHVPYNNDGAGVMYIGNVSIPPGESRMVDPSLLNPVSPAPVEATEPAEEDQAPTRKTKRAQ